MFLRLLLTFLLFCLLSSTSMAGLFDAVSKAVTDTAKDIGGAVKDAARQGVTPEMEEDIKAIDAIEEIKIEDIARFCERFKELRRNKPRQANEYLKYAFNKLSTQFMNSKTREELSKNDNLMFRFSQALARGPYSQYDSMFNPYIQMRSGEKYREVAEAISQREEQERIAAQQKAISEVYNKYLAIFQTDIETFKDKKDVNEQDLELLRKHCNDIRNNQYRRHFGELLDGYGGLIGVVYASLLEGHKNKFKDNNDIKTEDLKFLEKLYYEIQNEIREQNNKSEFYDDLVKLSNEYETQIRMVKERIKTQLSELSEIKQKLIKFENQLEKYPITQNMYGKEWDMEAADLDVISKEYNEIMQYYKDNKNYCDLGEAFDRGKHESIQYMFHKRFSSLIEKYEKFIQKKKEYEIAKQKRADAERQKAEAARKVREEFEKNMQDSNYIYANRAICKSEIPLYKAFKSGMRPEAVLGAPLTDNVLQRAKDLGYYAVYFEAGNSGSAEKEFMNVLNGTPNDSTVVQFVFAQKEPEDANAALVRVDVKMSTEKISMNDIIQKYKNELRLNDKDTKIQRSLKEKNVQKIEADWGGAVPVYRYEIYELSCNLQKDGKSVVIRRWERKVQYLSDYSVLGEAEKLKVSLVESLQKSVERTLQISISDENQVAAYRKFYEADMKAKQKKEREAKEKEKNSMLDF